MKRTINQQKEYAHELFMTGLHSMERIAAFVGVAPQTMSAWAKKGGWYEARTKRLHQQKSFAGRCMDMADYDLWVLERFAEAERKKFEKSQDYVPQPLDKGVVDSFSKIYKAIAGPQAEYKHHVEVLTAFWGKLSKSNLTLSKEVGPYIEEYLAQKAQEYDQ